MPEIKEEWGSADVVISNAMLATSVLSAAAGGRPGEEEDRKPLFSSLLPLYVAFMHLFLLRKVLCRNCHYYGQCCSTGWGKLAPLWGERGDESRLKNSLSLPAAFWITYPLIGAGGILSAFRRDRDITRLRYLAVFALSLVGFNSWHVKRGCLYCYHREECPLGKSAMKKAGGEVDL